MKHYPFFVTEVFFLLIFIAIIPVVYFHQEPISYAAAIVAAGIFVLVSVTDHNKYRDFEKAVKGIKGVRSWETEFLSAGTLLFDYKGEYIRYTSCIGAANRSYIPVTYDIRLQNRSDISFDLVRGGKWLGEFLVHGNRKFLDKLRQDITGFDRKYPIRHIRNKEGVLDIGVELDFVAKGAPPPGKLGDMTQFLEDLLEFGYKVNKKLKPGKKRKKKR
jgi:hypothetical protein